MLKVLNFEEVQHFLNKLGTTEFIVNREKFDISDPSQPSGIMNVVDLLAGAFPDNWSFEECIRSLNVLAPWSFMVNYQSRRISIWVDDNQLQNLREFLQELQTEIMAYIQTKGRSYAMVIVKNMFGIQSVEDAERIDNLILLLYILGKYAKTVSQ
jgi:hypothetical protein